ncbi:hypothetical protein Natpe_4019 (plasmid) [Natrinema pellirubrum DSM 15624]|uniref:Uncharacterized protein n=1 Tax=Natrinema pellirubrum (strain DSM 15624 / CIP 106293 / JCM 10476 / NCIMB 786 / 157) TaxID=797303 RepID=L0JR68_NATP1|nr:hypothetical protein Natpe_4019 [Natrinema pellirubrum DSM 15624]
MAYKPDTAIRDTPVNGEILSLFKDRLSICNRLSLIKILL